MEKRNRGEEGGYYKYTAKTEELKTYTIGNEVGSDKFGPLKKPIISAVKNSSGKDRFYVMSLEDLDDSGHSWYHNAWGKLPEGKLTEETDGRIVAEDENDFGTGIENTKYWLGKYNTIEGVTEDSNDVWNVIRRDENKAKYPLEKWFVPSKSEWSAFIDMLYDRYEECGLSDEYNDYLIFDLKNYYLTSSQNDTAFIYEAQFRLPSICVTGLNLTNEGVRLSTTF